MHITAVVQTALEIQTSLHEGVWGCHLAEERCQ